VTLQEWVNPDDFESEHFAATRGTTGSAVSDADTVGHARYPNVGAAQRTIVEDRGHTSANLSLR
jgi:hypothetical protein